MPRTSGRSIPAYRKHRPTGQAVVSISGRDHYLGPSRHEGQQDRIRPADGRMDCRLDTILVTTANGHHHRGISRQLQNLRPMTCRVARLTAISAACRALRLRYGKTLAIDFGPLALKAVREQFVANGMARTYCNRLVDIIRRLFKWAASEQLVPVSTWQR